MTPEKRTFQIHPQLLFDVIQRQAGSLTKALCEGVMNSIDAGATSIAVTLTENTATIADDGKGFRSREEIELFFETFGQPHREGDSVYGTFRMGRGQLFSFGVNHWVSGHFGMGVDIKNRGLDYDLTENPKAIKGCSILIDLYKPLTMLQQREIADDLRRAVRYVPVPVTLDGERINLDPAKQKWDLVDENAYYKFGTGRLSVYNLGVFVNDNRAYSLGIGGVIVAKQQLRLNFARNDVLNDCKVWQRIAKVLRARADNNITKKGSTLNAEERALLARRLRSGDLSFTEAIKAPVIQDCTGRWLSIDRLAHMAYDHNKTITIGVKGPKAEKVQRARLAVAINEDVLDTFQVDSLEELIEKVIKPHVRYWDFNDPVELDTLVPQDGDRYDIIPPQQWTPQEEIVMSVCTKTYSMAHAIGGGRDRRIVLGDSDVADGWTDGASFIAINRGFLKGKDAAAPSTWTAVALLLAHEYCHGGASSETHIHGPEFYEQFHDASFNVVPTWVQRAMQELSGVLDRMKAKASKHTLKWLDRIAAAERQGAEFDEALLAAKAKRELHLVEAKPEVPEGKKSGAKITGQKNPPGSYGEILMAQGFDRAPSAPGTQLWVHAGIGRCDIDTKNGKWTLTRGTEVLTGRLTPSLAKVLAS